MIKTVLVIDDNEIFRFIFSEWLRSEGFDSIIAKDGFEGIQCAQAQHPDLIFCDVNMPEMNGIEVLEQLRDDPNISHIPFFFLTSETGLKASLMQQPGVRGVILKGSEMYELHQLLTTIDTKK